MYPVAAVRGHVFNQSSFMPSNISGLVAWYDFTSTDYLYQDEAKTTPVTSNDDPIGAVSDRSGNSNDITQDSAGARPTYKSSYNGISAAYFSSASTYLEKSGAIVTATPWEIFVVMYTDTWSSYTAIVFTTQTAGTYAGMGITTGPALSAETRSSGGPSLSTKAISVDSWTICSARSSSSTSRFARVNASDGIENTTEEAFPSSPTGLMVSGYQLGNPVLGIQDGALAEILIYTSDISAADRAQLESYLSNKHSISI